MSSKADWQIRDMELTLQRLRDENQRLRVVVETAAAMVKHTDPDLSAALLRTLAEIRPT